MNPFNPVGVDYDGRVICQDLVTYELYNCGETPEEFFTDGVVKYFPLEDNW